MMRANRKKLGKLIALVVTCTLLYIVTHLYFKFAALQDPIGYWLRGLTNESEGRFLNYDKMFARLSDVIIDPSLAIGMNLEKGYFSLSCETPPHAGFSRSDHLQEWNSAVTCNKNKQTTNRIGGMTLAIKRYEYVNLYHTMTDFYNAFLMMLIFDQTPDNVTILWVDAHPKGGLDHTWDVLFGDTVRVGHIKDPTLFDDMVWSVMGYNSPLYEFYTRTFVPYLKEFRDFFLTRHKIYTKRTLNCDKLNILFIWRRNYVAHPGNPTGSVTRKIVNEDEIIANLKHILPTHRVKAIQMDILPMKDQLELVSNTDILLGMHGAGLSHTLFLPDHAGLIEFYPTYWSKYNFHFRSMAYWRGLTYRTWQNKDASNEKEDFHTYIPLNTVNRMVLEVKEELCRQQRN